MLTIQGKPPYHPVWAARDYCLELSPGSVDAASFNRVADAIDDSDISGYMLSSVEDLQKLCEAVGFLVVSDADGKMRAYLPGEWVPTIERSQ